MGQGRKCQLFGEIRLPGSAVCKLGWVFRLMHSLHSISGVEKPWSDPHLLFTLSYYWHHLSWESDHSGRGWKVILGLKFPQNLWIAVVGILFPYSPANSLQGHTWQMLSVETTSLFQIKCYNSIFTSALLNFHLWTTCFYNLWQHIESETFWLLIRTSGGHLTVTAQVTICLFQVHAFESNSLVLLHHSHSEMCEYDGFLRRKK